MTLKEVEYVIDVRHVCDRQQVFGTSVGKGPQARAYSARKDESLQDPVVPLNEKPIMAIPTATTTTPSQRRAVTCS